MPDLAANRRELLAGATMAVLIAGGPAPLAAAEARSRPNLIATRDGTPLFVRSWGRGPTIVFTHSLGLSSEIWVRQMIHLADAGYRCLAYDRRGHGRSGVPAGGYDLDTLADDLAQVIDGSGAGEVMLVGHSMGAGEIVRYLARHGASRVSRIALVAPTTPCLLASPSNPAGLPRAAFDALEAQWTADFPKWVDDNKRPFFRPETSGAMADWLSRQMLATSLPVLLACNRAMVATDHRPGLARIDRPVLVLHGDKDVSAPLELTGRPTAAGISGARLIVYRGAPHGLFVTDAERVNADLAAFAAA